jgi:hypothetical protein
VVELEQRSDVRSAWHLETGNRGDSGTDARFRDTTGFD